MPTFKPAPREDQAFFEQHKDRQTHIRAAKRGEFEAEFAVLGPHLVGRRRLLIWRVPKGRPFAGDLIPIPFLAFADETFEDTDELGLRLLAQIMGEAAERHGMIQDNKKPVVLQ